MRYATIAAHVGMYTVAFMCRVFGVAPSGYYGLADVPHVVAGAGGRGARGGGAGRFRSEHASGTAARGSMPNSAPTVVASAASGSRGSCAGAAFGHGPRRRFRNTTLSKHREPIAPNLVARQFEVTAPNHVWVTDLT